MIALNFKFQYAFWKIGLISTMKVFAIDVRYWTPADAQVKHDDVIKWKQYPRYWPFVRGIHRSPVNSPHKGQWRRALMFSLICPWINGWINNRAAGDLRRPRIHYDITVMCKRMVACTPVCISVQRNLGKPILKSRSVNKDVLTLVVIGWRMWCPCALSQIKSLWLDLQIRHQCPVSI